MALISRALARIAPFQANIGPTLVLIRSIEQQHRRFCSAQIGTSSISMLGSATPWEISTNQSIAPNESTRAKRSTATTRHQALTIHQAATNIRSEQTSVEPSFYSEDIDCYAAMDQQPVTLQRLLEICQPPSTCEKLLQNAQYLCRERPVRYAKRVKLFQRLPYIVNINPHINSAYQVYYQNFEESQQFPMVKSLSDEHEFIKMLARQSKSLKDIMSQIARGFYECRRYFGNGDRCQFLDQLIKMRIGLRLITSQHLALYDQFQASKDGDSKLSEVENRYKGIVDSKIRLANIVQVCAQGVQAMCDMSFGDSPSFIVDGQTDIEFSYIPSHLDYMLTELLKNAFHASLRMAENTKSEISPVAITISKGAGKVAVRIRDRGGGIPSRIHNKVFDYSFTTFGRNSTDDPRQETPDAADGTTSMADQNMVSGLGFGLPMTKIYAEYFGGTLNIISLEGYGCDVFLELPSIKVDRTPTIQI